MLAERDPRAVASTRRSSWRDARGPMLERVGLRISSATGIDVESASTRRSSRSCTTTGSTATPVLPGVMGIEAFAEAAALAVPGWRVVGLEDVEFLAPFKFYPGRAARAGSRGRAREQRRRGVRKCAAARPARARGAIGAAGDAPLPRPRALRARAAEGAAARSAPEPGGRRGRQRRGHLPRTTSTARPTRCSSAPGAMGRASSARLAGRLPPNHVPAELPLFAAPRLIELCFQTAGILEIGTHGSHGTAGAHRARDLRSATVRSTSAAVSRSRRRATRRRRLRRRRRRRQRAACCVQLEGYEHGGAARARFRRRSALRCGAADRSSDGRADFERIAIVNRGEAAMRADPRRARAESRARRPSW